MKKSRKWKLAIAMVVILGLAPFLAPAWSPINCRHQDVDLDTGRARYTKMFYWIPVKTEIKHTPFSEALGVTDLKTESGDWKRVNTFSPGVRHSPHYTYHGAFAMMSMMNMQWEVTEYTAEAKKLVVAHILKLLKLAEDDTGADDFVRELYDLKYDFVTVEDIEPLIKKHQQPRKR